jgi:hypothetical protein
MITYIWPPQSVSVAVPPLEFLYNGASQTVTQDTSVPANNRPLPAGLYIVKDGVIHPVTKDTATPANTLGVPVEIVAASGTPINITAGDINVQLTDLGVNFDAVRIGDGSGVYILVNADGSINVNDAAALAELQALNLVDFATEAKQDSQITELQSINTELDTQTTELQSINTELNTQTTELQSINSELDTQTLELQDIEAELVTLNTVDFATEAKQDSQITELQSINTELDTQSGLIGAANETAPATDTAASGLNGRLQRIAQRLTSLIALLPASLGQKTMAESLAVTIASDQSALSVTQTALTGTYQEITNLTTVAQTFTAPAGAKWFKIMADEANTANVRYKVGAAATTTSGMQLQSGRSEDNMIGGDISVIAESGTNQKVYVQFGA